MQWLETVEDMAGRVGRCGSKTLPIVITFSKAHSSDDNHTTSAMSSGVVLKEETHHITMCKSSNDGTARAEVGFIVGVSTHHLSNLIFKYIQ